MKNIKTLLIILLGLISLGIQASDTLYVRFNNYYVKDGGANSDTMIFDVEYKSFTAGTYLFAFQHDIAFNSTVFGPSAKPIVSEIEQLELVGNAMTTVLGPTSPTSTRFRYAISQLLPPYNPANLALVPTTEWAGVIRYKMLIQNNTQNAGLQFITSGTGSMAGNQKFVKVVTSTGSTYVPIVAKNNLLNFPTTPTVYDLMISETADPTGSNGDFVEIYNAGDAAVDFSGTYWYLTSYNGVTYSSVRLSGIVTAGHSYVVGGTTYSYTGKPANQTSAVVDGTGTLTFFLSMYDPYPDGLLIDNFGASAYTGGHAVRLYTVDAPAVVYDATEWSILPGSGESMTPGSHKASTTWDGSADADWNNNDNWVSTFVPDAGHLASIPNAGETIPVIGAGDYAAAFDLTIGGGTSGLVIESDAVNGDGSLVTYGTVSGITTVQRYLDADRYYYITKPVTSAVSGVFLHCWLFTYNELANDWDPFIAPETTPLGDMQGYAVWTSSVNSYDPNVPPIGDTTVAYEGILNTGDLSKSLTFSIDGWNFTGNPYPSAVDWTADGWTKTNLLTDAYSVWNGTNYGTYTVGSGGTNGATEFIPAAQGFFVQVSAAGTLGLNNSVRTHAALDFWKSEQILNNRLSLTISNGMITDETVIHFNENASEEMDYLYDASKLIAMAAPQAYTMMGDRMMAINTYNNPGQTAAVTMGINAPEAGEYTISASNIESFNGTPIFLEDLLTGQYINLRETSSYSFSSEAGMSSRFVVHFTNTQGIGDDNNEEVNNIYSFDRNIYVNFNGNHGEISLYNILGQEISRSSAANGLNVIAAPQGNAVYIVKVISDNVSVTKKVFVK